MEQNVEVAKLLLCARIFALAVGNFGFETRSTHSLGCFCGFTDFPCRRPLRGDGGFGVGRRKPVGWDFGRETGL